MRTKTTILSAVALAAGLLSASAQVYSANVVGYYNVVTPLGSPGSSKKHLISNQLKGTGNTNLINVVLQSGLGDAHSQNVNLLTWNGSSFDTFTYYGPTDAGAGLQGWYDGLGNACTLSLNQGQAAFLENASGLALTNTFVGEVVQGTSSGSVAAGLAPYSIRQPISTNLLAPSVLFATGDAKSQLVNLLHYNVAGQAFDGALTYYGPTDAGNAVGVWADGLGNDQTGNPAYMPTVGEGFFIDNAAGSYTWASSFTVQ